MIALASAVGREVPSPEERIEALAGAIEMLLQKHQRMQLAAVVLGATDSKSLDHSLREGDYRHARTMLTAGVFELATTIVNGGNEHGVSS